MTDTENKGSKPAPMDRFWAENDDSRGVSEPSLVVDVTGFEGPLELLLHLARHQKVDLARISILALAEQYLQFVERVRAMRLELAAVGVATIRERLPRARPHVAHLEAFDDRVLERSRQQPLNLVQQRLLIGGHE